jgi:hypothetical protein
MVNNINNILDKAVYVRIDKYDLTNSTVHALVLADITEKAYNDYSYAFGIKPVIFSGSSSSSSSSMMNMGSGMGMGMMIGSSGASTTDGTTKNHSKNMTYGNKSTLVNATAYQQGQGTRDI